MTKTAHSCKFRKMNLVTKRQSNAQSSIAIVPLLCYNTNVIKEQYTLMTTILVICKAESVPLFLSAAPSAEFKTKSPLFLTCDVPLCILKRRCRYTSAFSSKITVVFGGDFFFFIRVFRMMWIFYDRTKKTSKICFLRCLQNCTQCCIIENSSDLIRKERWYAAKSQRTACFFAWHGG